MANLVFCWSKNAVLGGRYHRRGKTKARCGANYTEQAYRLPLVVRHMLTPCPKCFK